jgi:uncharacterized protein YxeA
MIKYLKTILIVCPIILTILLGINIYKYYSYQKDNNSIIKNTNNIKKQIIENTNKIDELNKELTSLKEEKKEELWKYNRWLKWNQEILEKIK